MKMFKIILTFNNKDFKIIVNQNYLAFKITKTKETIKSIIKLITYKSLKTDLKIFLICITILLFNDAFFIFNRYSKSDIFVIYFLPIFFIFFS